MKVGTKSAPAVAIRPPGPSRREAAENVLLKQLIKAAPNGAAAWDVLAIGSEWERSEDGVVMTSPVLMSPERLAANNVALEVDASIATAWMFLGPMQDRGEPIPRGWIDRLCELHDESQDALFELDAIVRAECEEAGRPARTVYADVLHRASMEAHGYLTTRAPAGPSSEGVPGSSAEAAQGRSSQPAPDHVDAAMGRLARAIDGGHVDVVRNAAKRYVSAAVRARYGEGVDDAN